MSRPHILVVVILAALLAGSRGLLRAQTPRDAATAFKAAQQLEEVQGDLKGAIEAYKKIATGSDRALAAKALLRMGECYQKLGDAQAAQVYEQIVRDYSQQPEAAEARARLGGLRPMGRQATAKRDSVAWTTGDWPIAVSADGRFAAVDSGDLAVHDLETGADRVLVKAPKGESPDDEASFSRDGSQLAYTWWKGNREELQLVSLKGPTTPRALLNADVATGYSLAGWTADGQAIAVVAYGKESIGLGLASVRGAALRIIKSVKRPQNINAASLSRDDRYIAFDLSSPNGDAHSIFLISTDGTREVPLVQTRFSTQVVGWSTDNSRLLFTGTSSESVVLYAQRVVDGRADGAPETLTSVPGRLAALGIATAGSLYYVPMRLRAGADLRLATLDFSSGLIASPPSGVRGSYSAESDAAPDFSPDGKALAYVATSTPFLPTDHGALHLVVQILDSSARSEVGLDLSSVGSLRWAPDGESFAAYAAAIAPDRRFEIWHIDRRTGAAARIAPFEPGTNLGLPERPFSRDGTTLYYIRAYTATKETALIAHDLASGVERELFRGAQDAQGSPTPVLSPDGKTVYYRKGVSGEPPFQVSAFMARDVASGAERELLRRNLGGVNLSPDGRCLVTSSNDAPSRSRAIWLIPTDGAAARELMRIDLPKDLPTTGVLPVNLLGFDEWSADSHSVIVQKSFGSTRVERQERWWVPIDGHAPPAFLDFGPSREIRIHPDNRRVAFMVPPPPPSGDNEVHILEHFLSSVK